MAVKQRFPRRAAVVACNGGCRAEACDYGCVGCRICESVCRFEAVTLNDFGVAEVDASRCMACGLCVRECPRQIISIHSAENPIVVKCSNRDAAKDARKACAVSCLGCGICQKVCPAGAARVEENLSHIDEELCLSCGQCAVKCPHGAIYDLRGVLTPER